MVGNLINKGSRVHAYATQTEILESYWIPQSRIVRACENSRLGPSLAWLIDSKYSLAWTEF